LGLFVVYVKDHGEEEGDIQENDKEKEPTFHFVTTGTL
jgi:hypothetical protein